MSRARDIANIGDDVATGEVVTTASPSLGRRNRIINGDMRIDQRNAGASATNTGATTFYLDRWVTLGTTSAGQYSVQQDSNAPAGFSNSSKITVTTVDSSLAATDRYTWMQRLEGYTISDFDFGKSSAKTITLSFYVRSSVTGSFGAGIQNGNSTRSYPFNYTISQADTWEYKTVTIPGDTSGTWPTNNTRAMIILWALGVGSDRQGTANTWADGNFYATSESTNLMATSGATWYITGVQLEVGSVATPFEHRSYGEELALCQRYYLRRTAETIYGALAEAGYAYDTIHTRHFIVMKPEMRAIPSITSSGTIRAVASSAYSVSGMSISTNESSKQLAAVTSTTSGVTTNNPYGLSANNDATAYIALDAEL